MTVERRRIPLHDETAAIACTIDRADLPDRIALLERLRTNLERLERSEHGLVLHLVPSADVEADARRFAVDEKACCTFWGFEVRADDGLRLYWDAPASAAHLTDALAAWLDGDEPLTALSGLL